ncbi:MAG: carboxylesterase/lipase family protein [Ilumatobacteraceae bacterium]
MTSSGLVRGDTSEGVHRFLGVPYAEPPVGALRYGPPQRRAAWDGELDATAFGAVCIQAPMPGTFGEIGTPSNPSGDDCLNLNVWTPDPAASGLPVLVWIHGGAFYAGSGIDPVYDGTAFARDGVVCVTINYRLGAQGFAHFADHFPQLADSGNAGLLDQIAALEWVRDNIAAFGGDPTNVTIAGESAGGMSVGCLLASPRAKGLFHRAIAESGAAHNGLSAGTASMIAGHILAEVGVAPGDLDALLAVSPDDMLAAQVRLNDELAQTRDGSRFGEAAASAMLLQPTYGTSVLPQRPIDAIAAGAAAGVDVMIGTTREETLIFIVDLKDIFNEALVEATLDATMGAAGRSGAQVLDVYRRNRPGAVPHELAAAAETDRMFRLPAIRLAEAQIAHNPNVWMYQFDWRSTARGGEFGACHFLEVPFAFDRIDNDEARGIAGDPPQALADIVHAAWVSFVSTGNPNHDGLPAWAPYDAGTRSTAVFDLPPRVLDDPAADERELWAGVI